MSAPPVRIESVAWTDLRYNALALLLGLGESDIALIRCAKIWRWQTEHYTAEAPTYSVSPAVVIGALGLDGPAAIVAADLAELDPDGRIRIRGGRDAAGRSRIDWLWNDRQQRKAAGVASARRRKAAGDPRAAAGRFGDLPTGDQRATNGRPTGDQREPNDTTNGHQALRSPDSGLRPDLRSGTKPQSPRPPAAPSGSPPRGPARIKPKVGAPEVDPEPSDADRAYAARHSVPMTEWAAMFDWHRKEGKGSADWSASFRTRVGNAVKWRIRDQQNQRPLTGLAATEEILRERGHLPQQENQP